MMMLNPLHLRLSVLMFLQFFVWGSWFVTQGTYLLQQLRFTGQEVGMIYGTTAIASMVSPFLLGVLADRRFSAERMLSVLHLSGAALMFSATFLEVFWPYYFIILLYTFTYMPTFSLAASLCFHHLDKPTRQFPRVRAFGTLGWVLASLLVGFLDVEAEVLPMYISGATSLVAGLYCLSLPQTPPQGNKTSLREWFGPEVRALLRDRSFRVIMTVMVGISIPIAFYYSFVNPYLNEIGIENAAGKMSIGQISEIIFMLLLPWVIYRWGLKTTIFIGLFLWGARYLLFAYGDQDPWGWLIYVAIFTHGIAFCFSGLSVQIYMDQRVSPALRSTAQGFYTFLTLGLGTLIGTLLAGSIVELFSTSDGQFLWRQIWMVPAGIGILVSIYFWLRFRSAPKS